MYDPWVSPHEADAEYGIRPVPRLEAGLYDAVILAVAHMQFKGMGAGAIRGLGKSNAVLYDLKYVLPSHLSDLRL